VGFESYYRKSGMRERNNEVFYVGEKEVSRAQDPTQPFHDTEVVQGETCKAIASHLV
jgi:hypothetical protein